MATLAAGGRRKIDVMMHGTCGQDSSRLCCLPFQRLEPHCLPFACAANDAERSCHVLCGPCRTRMATYRLAPNLFRFAYMPSSHPVLLTLPTTTIHTGSQWQHPQRARVREPREKARLGRLGNDDAGCFALLKIGVAHNGDNNSGSSSSSSSIYIIISLWRIPAATTASPPYLQPWSRPGTSRGYSFKWKPPSGMDSLSM